MNRKQKLAMGAFAFVVIATSYWTGYVHGSRNLDSDEIVISIALPSILIWTLAKLTFAFCFRRGSLPPGRGSQPPTAPSPGVPVPRPPGAPPDIRCEHAA